MKNYEEVTENVFRKSEEIIARNKRRRNTMIKIGASACCLTVIGGVGAAAWSRGRNPAPVEQPVVSDNNTVALGVSKTDVVSGNSVITDSIGTWNGQMTSNDIPGSVITDSSGTCNGQMTSNDIPSSVITDSSGTWSSQMTSNDSPCSATTIYSPIDNSGSTSICITTRIDGFEIDDNETKVAPDNGQIHISKALQAAMEKYGDVDENGNEIIYRVVIAYLQDRQTIPATYELWEQEHARIKEQLEFGLAFETYSWDWGEHSEHWIHADLTKSQIESFTADPKYGYVIDLYDNYHGYPITANADTPIFNGTAQSE